MQPQPYGKSRGDTLPSLRGYRQRALRFLRQGEDERRIPCLLQETGRQEELQVATRLYALSYLHARQVYLWGDKRGLVQQICNFKPISNDFYDEQNGENFKMKPPP